MILLFTSKHCAWCNTVKAMLKNEVDALAPSMTIHEIDVDVHSVIARAFGIVSVPTMVSGNMFLSGLPTSSDIQSFVLQAFPGSPTRSHGQLHQFMKSVHKKLRHLASPSSLRHFT